MTQSIDTGEDPHEWAAQKIEELVPEKGDCGLTVYRTKWGAFCRTEEAEAIIKELKRALWLARANYCHHFRVDWYIRRHPNTMQTEKSMENKMIIAEMDCRAKARQFEEKK